MVSRCWWICAHPGFACPKAELSIRRQCSYVGRVSRPLLTAYSSTYIVEHRRQEQSVIWSKSSEPESFGRDGGPYLVRVVAQEWVYRRFLHGHLRLLAAVGGQLLRVVTPVPCLNASDSQSSAKVWIRLTIVCSPLLMTQP